MNGPGSERDSAASGSPDGPDRLDSPRNPAAPTIDHLGIAVNSLAAARTFYEALGLLVTHEEDVEHEGVRTAMIPIGESRIELLEPLRPDSPIGRFLTKRGEGLHHVALHVPDIEATWQEMRGRGIEIVSPAVQTGAGGHLYFFIHPRSAGGVLLEICQDHAPAPHGSHETSAPEAPGS